MKIADRSVQGALISAITVLSTCWHPTGVDELAAQEVDRRAAERPAIWTMGRGPQGDAIRIYNYVRLVRAPLGSQESRPTGRC
jgi:hypothetical protein